MPGPLHIIRLIALLAAGVVALPALAGEAEEIESAIVFGRCAEAADRASALTEEEPEDPQSWRLLADAERCRGAARAAVRAYLRLLELGGPDESVQDLVTSLRAQLGALRVKVETERPAPLRVEARIEGEQRPTPAVLQPDGAWLVADLEPGGVAVVEVRGTGVDALSAPAGATGAGVEAELTVRPTWRGIGLLQLLRPAPDGVRVEVPGLDGWGPLEQGPGVRVTAGDVPVALTGPRGRLETTVAVPADGRVRFDPSLWVPSSLTVRGAPAGAALQLFLEGVEPPMERSVTLPAEGSVDPEWGIRIADPVEVTGLVGGVGSLVMQHPELGLAASELVLETGAPNSLELDWRQLEGSAAVRSRYLAWQEGRARVTAETRAGMGVGLAAGGGGLALSVIAWAAAGASNTRLNEARDSALAGEAHADGAQGWHDQHAAAATAERAWIGVAAVSTTVGVAGLGLAGVFGARGKVRLDRLGPWTPP